MNCSATDRGSTGRASTCPRRLFAPSSRSARSSPRAADVAEASRDWWPLALHWALAGQVPQLADVVVQADVDRRGRSRRAGVQQRPPAAHRRGWPQRRVRGGGAGVRRRGPRRDGARRRRRDRRDLRRRRGAPRHIRTRPRRRTAPGRAVGRPLPAEFRSRHRRRMDRLAVAPASTRRATARSRTWWSASRSCSPTAPSCARAARRRQRRVPTSRSCSSGPRARSA